MDPARPPWASPSLYLLYMYTYLYKYIYTHCNIYVYTCIYIYVQIFIHIIVCMYAYMYIWMHILTDAYTYIHVCIYAYVRVYIYMHMCMYSWICNKVATLVPRNLTGSCWQSGHQSSFAAEGSQPNEEGMQISEIRCSHCTYQSSRSVLLV